MRKIANARSVTRVAQFAIGLMRSPQRVGIKATADLRSHRKAGYMAAISINAKSQKLRLAQGIALMVHRGQAVWPAGHRY
jgi:hypothetical protein